MTTREAALSEQLTRADRRIAELEAALNAALVEIAELRRPKYAVSIQHNYIEVGDSWGTMAIPLDTPEPILLGGHDITELVREAKVRAEA